MKPLCVCIKNFGCKLGLDELAAAVAAIIIIGLEIMAGIKYQPEVLAIVSRDPMMSVGITIAAAIPLLLAMWLLHIGFQGCSQQERHESYCGNHAARAKRGQ